MAGAGTSQSAYGYTNEYTSQGLIYLRARMYSPQSGRFLTKDSWMGDYYRPMSYNAWLYVQANSINFTDPTGHDYEYGEVIPPDKRDLTNWLPSAAVYMATDPEILEFRRLISSTDGAKNFQGFLKFKNVVQAGARFDVKLKIKDRLGRSIKLGENWYEYSTSGNILYGFYGSAAGFKAETLHVGAGYAQVRDVLDWVWVVGYLCEDNPDKFPDFGGPAHYFDTPDDYHAVDFGIWLYQRYYVPTGTFTRDNFVQGLNSYEFAWGLRGVLNPKDYKPNTIGPYAPDYFEQ
jgi:RHS repeat-associated protein